jgi:hypothetical protein
MKRILALLVAATGIAFAQMPATVVDIAVENEGFSTLVAAVTEAGLVETLSSEGPFTVFAPTDDAFAAALEALGLTPTSLPRSKPVAVPPWSRPSTAPRSPSKWWTAAS